MNEAEWAFFYKLQKEWLYRSSKDVPQARKRASDMVNEVLDRHNSAVPNKIKELYRAYEEAIRDYQCSHFPPPPPPVADLVDYDDPEISDFRKELARAAQTEMEERREMKYRLLALNPSVVEVPKEERERLFDTLLQRPLDAFVAELPMKLEATIERARHIVEASESRLEFVMDTIDDLIAGTYSGTLDYEEFCLQAERMADQRSVEK